MSCLIDEGAEKSRKMQGTKAEEVSCVRPGTVRGEACVCVWLQALHLLLCFFVCLIDGER